MSQEPTACQMLSALLRNPELIKVMLANGLLLVAKLVVLILVLPDVKSRIWSKDMTQYQSIVSLLLALTAILTSSAFGAFSDKFGRRLAAAIIGVVSFLPSWVLLVFGMNDRGLYASSIGSVISGIGVNSNVLLLLASDVTDPDDRQLAFGAFQSATLFLNLLLMGIPSLLLVTLDVFPRSPVVVMAYQVVLSLVYFIVLASIRVPARSPEVALRPQEDGEAEVASHGCWCARALAAALAPLKLCADRSLRCLAITTFLVAFCGDMLMDVGGQFFRETLDLIPFGTLHEQQLVSVWSSLPAAILVFPGFVLAGLLSKWLGSRRFLLLFIPVSAALMASGVSLLFVREFWFVGVVTVLQGYGNLINIPLQHLVTVHAAEGREGEAMGFMGACQQTANLLGNVALVFATPLLQKSGLKDPLWIYYPVAALFVLLAVLPASGIGAGAAQDAKEGAGKGEGEGAGKREGALVDIEAPSLAQQSRSTRSLSRAASSQEAWGVVSI